MRLTVSQCRAGRALLGWSMSDLAVAAGTGVMTVNRFEAGQVLRQTSIDRIAAALAAAGVALIAGGETSQNGGEGVRLASPADVSDQRE